MDSISKKAFQTSSTTDSGAKKELYDISINGLDGSLINLSTLKGKFILFVNVASKCGFTNQYKDLERLYKEYQDRLMIVGLPCNQFGSQEPGSSEEILSFCEKNYGVSFLMTQKVQVKGKAQHPLYQWLTQKSMNGRSNSAVRWNFQKYLVSPEGTLIDYFYSTTGPLSSKITKNLV
ncbi:glutathione peroxidase [Flagellimonas allohymeniacidonis]|uniref:glutathione peroxidase n=1 Tax=Flagellimonas allohymeniacidonis TaxID=2517819 RepID=UPI003AAD1A74